MTILIKKPDKRVGLHIKVAAGVKLGKLLVLRKIPAPGRSRWECLCDCGTHCVKSRDGLAQGIKSCGCFGGAPGIARTHGGTHTATYMSWRSMLTRCDNSRSPNFYLYGGRGITVCQQWRDFSIFRRDMGERPVGKTLERNNSDGNYEPGNCSWATPAEQQRNRRCNRWVEAFGEKKLIVDWAKDARCAVGFATLDIRIRRGFDPVRAISTPPLIKRSA